MPKRKVWLATLSRAQLHSNPDQVPWVAKVLEGLVREGHWTKTRGLGYVLEIGLMAAMGASPQCSAALLYD